MPTSSDLWAIVALLAGAAIAVVMGLLQYRKQVAQRAQNAEAKAEDHANHAENELRIDKESDDEAGKELHRLLHGDDDHGGDGKGG